MTEITITNKNRIEYRDGSYPEVTSIIWKAGVLGKYIFKNFPNLTKLVCSYNKITDLRPLQHYCTGLTELICNNNKIIDLSPLKYCTGLTRLICNNNKIIDINSLQYCTKLTILNCCNNKIIDLSSLQYCTELTELIFHNNKIIDLTPLRHCSKLTKLSCSRNKIIDLSPLQHCLELTKLYCATNEIKDLTPLQYCTRLTKLDCSNNDIRDLSPLQYCTELTLLNCCYNLIKNLNPLQYCTRLNLLNCKDNPIADITSLQYCTELTELDCSFNVITSLEPLIYLRRLTYLDTFNNPLNPPSIQVTRFLETIEERLVRNYNTNNMFTIYSDRQNVHDVKVQQSVMDSVRNLMKDKLPNNKEIILDIDSVLNSELQANTKSRLLEYFEDNNVHVILLITYKELFAYVWNRIINNTNKLELLKILDDNIQDSECKCFTGRFNRTLSTLVGFYDDIEINISDNSRISAIILQIKDSIIPYDSDKHRELAQTALSEAGYDSDIINLWTSAIE